jgi:amino acid adenylation domain-containing protein
VSTENDPLERKAKLSAAKRSLLARRLRGESPSAPETGSIPRRRPEEPAPLSFAQLRLWFLDQLMPGTDVYNIPATQRLRGPLQVKALESSLSEIIRRHEILRTTIRLVGGEPVGVVAPHVSLSLPVTDLSAIPEDAREGEALRLADEEARQAFDLQHGPLLRTALLRLGPEDHVLLLTLHHIVSDGWSMRLFFREMAALYGAFSAGAASPLPELPIQYADFAAWQRSRMVGCVQQAHLSYWKERLAAAPILELPRDFLRPALQSFRGERQSMLLPEDLSAALRLLSHAEGATLFMTLLAAFKILLSRFSGQEDIAVGAPIAGRNLSQIEGLIGFFINTLVLRTDLRGNPTYRELLGRVRGISLGAYAHADLPFEMLVETLQPQRDLSRTPLFQVFFNMVSFVDDPLQLPDLTVSDLVPSETRSKFDLTLYAGEAGENLTLLLVYNRDLFAPERMTELLRQYQNLLWQITEDPDASVMSYSLLTREARVRLPDPGTAIPSDRQEPIQDGFLAQATRRPEALAVSEAGGGLTYREVDLLSNRLAHYLLDHGIERGELVAIYGARKAALVWAMLGVLKAGAAFLILDSAYPAPALIERLKIAQPRGWLRISHGGGPPDSLEKFVAALPYGCRLELPAWQNASPGHSLFRFPETAPVVKVCAEDLAYVAFTSGTTGAPKAIPGAHGPVSHFIHWHIRFNGLNESDRFSVLSGLSHDPLLRDIFTPLGLGATLCIPTFEEIHEPGRLREWLGRNRISVIHLTPALGELIYGGAARSDGSALPALRYAFFGADRLTRHDVARLKRVAPGVTCVNYYGTTETPQAMGFFQVPEEWMADPDRESGPVPLPVGEGIDGVQLLVLNGAGKLAGIGEAGEVCVRTPYLSRGYLGDEALTNQRFVENPWTGTPADRMFRTGDLGRYRLDGPVELFGRADDQVKIRGFRVEPKAVENVLAQHPGVRASHVLAAPGPAGDRRLVAYIVPADDAVPLASDLHRFLRDRLPAYLIPSAFAFLGALPMTPNGKVDRHALPDPDLDPVPTAPGAAFSPPETVLERALAEIWVQLLGVKAVGVHDNFFELGGHSLLATQFLSRLRDLFQVELPLREIFQTPTIAGLAPTIQAAQGRSPLTRVSGPTRVPREGYRVRRAPVERLVRSDNDHSETAESMSRAVSPQKPPNQLP